MAKRAKHTKARYAKLFDDRESLFPGIETVLFPNGENEIWFKDQKGNGFRITVSSGPSGLGLTVRRFVDGSNRGLTVAGNLNDAGWTPSQQVDMVEVSVTLYNTDERSQAFKRWYGDPKNNPYPEKAEGE